MGDAPILGKVARTPRSAFAGNKPGVRAKLKKRKVVRKIPIQTILLLAFSVLTVTFASLVYIKSQRTDIDEDTTGGVSFNSKLDAIAYPKEQIPNLDNEQTLEIVKKGLALKKPDDFEDYFILGTTANSTDALEKLRKLSEIEGSISDYNYIGASYYNHRHVGEVVVNMNSGQNSFNRLAQVVYLGNQQWKIDLDSYLRTSIPSWPEIISGQSPSSVVRVFLNEDNYFNGIYSDENVWAVFSMGSPDVDELMYAYVKKGSPQHIALFKIFDKKAESIRATLRIKKEIPDRSRQFEITQVIAENWVVTDQNFDEKLD